MELSSKNSMEKLIRDTLENYEFPYNNEDWLKLKKDLPKDSGWSPAKTVITSVALVAAVAVIVTSIIIFNENDLDRSNQNSDNPSLIAGNKNAPGNIEPSTDISDIESTILNDNGNNIKNEKPEISTHNDQENCNVAKESPEPDIAPTEVPVTDNADPEGVQPAETTGQKENARSYPEKEDNERTTPCAKFICDISEGCAPLNVGFYPVEKNESMIYKWDFGDGTTSPNPTPSHTYTEPGDYFVSLTVKYSKEDQLVTWQSGNPVKIKATPVAEFTCEGNIYTYRFTNLSQNAYTWRWTVQGQDISTDENPEYDFYYNGPREVILTAYHLNGCSHSFSQTIDVKIRHDYYMPSAFTPNGNGISDYYSPIGRNMQDLNFNMKIYNRQGQMIFETKDPDIKWDGKIMGTNRQSEEGVYTYEVVTIDKYGNVDKRIGPVTLLNLVNE
ncbi:MAG: gliding motility-associated C-terminal domain-containing protein [Bacteroidetes bacterium]|nr:gliding motility-associated C-terminal domain-containing protein [Bacteroidota bacterium]